jgi:6-pyruvoyl-tetrahydropterin synthase
LAFSEGESINHMDNIKHYKSGRMFVRDIDHLDCAVFDPELGVLGATWHVDVELSGELDDNGFVFDFGKIKKKFKQVLKETLDHSLVVPKYYSGLSANDDGDYLNLVMETTSNERWAYTCPKSAVYFLPAQTAHADELARALEREMASFLPPNVGELSVTLREESIPNLAGVFQYTHGLVHHDGGCQRLFHGHRSRIEIFRGKTRAYDLEKTISEDFFANTVHLVSSEQVTGTCPPILEKGKKGDSLFISYMAREGQFTAEIPAHKAILLHQSTSIESLAQNIADFLSTTKHEPNIMVRCFEGINKGGIASRQVDSSLDS